MLETLLDIGNWQDEYPQLMGLALDAAVRSKQVDVARLLLDKGASVEGVAWWKIADTHSAEMADVFFKRHKSAAGFEEAIDSMEQGFFSAVKTAGSTLIFDALKAKNAAPIDFADEFEVATLDAPDALEAPTVALLYQGGYLTIDRRIDGETVLLRIPNHEVSTSLYRGAGWCTSASTTIPPRGRSAR